MHLPWKASPSATKQSNYGIYKASIARGEGVAFETVRITADTRELALEVAIKAAAADEVFTALIDLISMEIKGHTLMSRLQFSNEGRSLAEKITAAISKHKGV